MKITQALLIGTISALEKTGKDVATGIIQNLCDIVNPDSSCAPSEMSNCYFNWYDRMDGGF